MQVGCKHLALSWSSFQQLSILTSRNCHASLSSSRAVAANAADMARLLLESGADPALRLKDKGRYTSALHLAAHHE